MRCFEVFQVCGHHVGSINQQRPAYQRDVVSLRDANNVYGYEVAQALVEVLKKCGSGLTRANVMKQAASLDLELGMLRPGIRVTTSPTDYQPIKQLYLIRFDGQDWAPIGN